MVTLVDVVTALVLIANVAPVAPAVTVTLEGALATDVSLLERLTCAPAGATPLNVTVPVGEFPPVTLVGLSESAERDGDADVEDNSKSQIAGLGSFSGSTTNFEGETI
jgi:hypothetical protein